jgi:hypothetical protein
LIASCSYFMLVFDLLMRSEPAKSTNEILAIVFWLVVLLNV